MGTTYTVNTGGLAASARKVIGDVKTFEDISTGLQSDSGSIGSAVGSDCPELSSAVNHYFAVMGLAYLAYAECTTALSNNMSAAAASYAADDQDAESRYRGRARNAI